ncbi:LANO_0A00518g1_1 [Lachancea nothofagi CBS 11611]|uniref:LANO_0A00518g1_1 n=1 Tax=Lachancea nothofagi CBS 11611 TaxID=1266666 RepID=A0A1G4ILS9_9SACH|nr:LANO_0A00518g1_1 [Lachancea nothofagi CBS 11611]
MTSIDNVPEIGYAFLKTYYQRMHQDPTKVHHLYSTTAELTHVDYQNEWNLEDDQLPTVKLIGKENISKFYTRHSKKVRSLQVKVDACDFQSAGPNNASIVILAVGEMCWTDTPSFRFCQSFLLSPVPSNPKIYDVTNDILRFVPQSILRVSDLKPECDNSPEELRDTLVEGSDDKPEETPEEQVLAPQNYQTSEKSGESIKGSVFESEKPLDAPENRLVKNVEENVEQPKDQQQQLIQEGEASEKQMNSSEPNGDSQQPTEDSAEETETALHESAPLTSNDTTKDKSIESEKPTAAEPTKKMNWASKLAAAESKDVPNVTTKYIRAEPLVSQPPKKVSERKSVSPSGLPRDAKDSKSLKKKQFNLVNKDGFYPVYVKGTGGVTDEQLVKALESEFGVVKKISSQETFAVIDFEDQRWQTEAIERGTLKINNIEVHMEPKTIRKINSPSAVSSASPSGQRFSKKHANKRKA